jgi:3-deoxy-manno-octulosonate cytidylyltransferase (CMP-KDO synthetase)
LLSSKESIAASAPERREIQAESALERRSMGPTHSRFAAALATRITAPDLAISVGIKRPENPAFSMTSDVLILIPARMASSRLPGKPLADIGGMPMIVRVMRRAKEAAVGQVAVATDSADIANAVTAAGGEVVMTRTDHTTGSDRIFEALGKADPQGRAKIVVNVQGDFPTLAGADIKTALSPLADPAVDIATLALEITDPIERTDPNVVKAICSPISPGRFRALYFTRTTAPSGEGPLYHHIGLYAYRRAALTRFVALPPSPLEQRERLEQLRALEAGMRIDVALTTNPIFGVDTAEHLAKARALLAH